MKSMKGPRIVKKKSINSEKDPYLLKIAPGDRAVCKKCGAVYHNKRWSLGKKTAVLPAAAKKISVVCTACQKIKDKFAEGYVTLHGTFLKAHKDEIISLVRNKEDRAMHFNPLDRIIEIKARKSLIEITTTTEKLAQRIGQMLKKAFDGEVEYKWSAGVKLARIVWTREEGAPA